MIMEKLSAIEVDKEAVTALTGPILRELRDADGFTKSFTVDQRRQYVDFFNRWGFVVIRDVLSQQDCEKSIAEIWKDLNQEKSPFYDGVLTPDDLSTLETKNLPRMTHLGIIGTMPCLGPQAWENRQNPKIYEVARTLMGRDDLWVNFDRYGFMRPTKQIKIKPNENTLVDRDDWKTLNGWLHWDLSPWTFHQSVMGFTNEGDFSTSAFDDFLPGHLLSDEEKSHLESQFGGTKLQGLIALQDAREQDGGFCTVPNFGPQFMQWALDHHDLFQSKWKSANFVHVPKEDPMLHRVIKVPIRAGCLLLWSAKQPHANYPNNSNQFRFVQYITPVPANSARWTRQFAANVLPMRGFVPSELGRKLFGIDSWPSACSLM